MSSYINKIVKLKKDIYNFKKGEYFITGRNYLSDIIIGLKSKLSKVNFKPIEIYDSFEYPIPDYSYVDFLNIKSFNHPQPYSYFEFDVNKLKENNHNPIYVTQMYMDNMFVFKTKEEATLAKEDMYNEVDGAYYDIDTFLYLLENYEKENNSEVLFYNIEEWK